MTKLAALMALSMVAPALPEAPDMETALAQAVEQQKNIFIDFTGTDWCTACIHLRDKIVESPEFDKAYGDAFILVSVDFPRTPKLVAAIPDEEKRRRENLLNSYRIEGLPGVVLMDSKGMPYEIIGGTRRTPQDYISLMEAGIQKREARDAAFKEAESLEGMAKAEALAKGLKVLPLACQDKYVKQIDEINAIDTQNTLGFKGMGTESQLRIKQFEELREIVAGFRGKLQPAELKDSILKMNDFLSRQDLMPEVRQEALSVRGDSYALLRDFDNMYKDYKAALEAAPETRAARRIRANVEHFENVVMPMLKGEQ